MTALLLGLDVNLSFVERLGQISIDTRTDCFAWALMPNHVNLLMRSGLTPISTAMRRLLTGYWEVV